MTSLQKVDALFYLVSVVSMSLNFYDKISRTNAARATGSSLGEQVGSREFLSAVGVVPLLAITPLVSAVYFQLANNILASILFLISVYIWREKLHDFGLFLVIKS